MALYDVLKTAIILGYLVTRCSSLKETGIFLLVGEGIKGNCLDNIVMKNFSGTLKSGCFYLNQFSYVNEPRKRKALEDYIHYYNNERINLKLKGLNPVGYRTQALKGAQHELPNFIESVHNSCGPFMIYHQGKRPGLLGSMHPAPGI
ncbi:Integrase core domain-containing protein [Kosakonia oryziphila]|uniref:Integrase core domain-containing protein n=1 Tax=Kosakonia oryziphila TaxID=1005667 RepID=A0A1C4B9W0_9ENTR|nr:Integrase core domain-containing protein [Kosakonia oryziphila]